MHFHDHYQSLGLNPRADAAAIKRAYRRLARRHHPDLNGAAGAQAAMARLNEAYQVLSDPKQRAAYDAVRESQVAPAAPAAPQPGPASTDWQPGFAGFVRPEEQPAPIRGIDARAHLGIPLSDAYGGAERDITIQPPGLEARLLRVQIPRGVQPGQTLRLPGQGGPGSAGGEAGDLLLEIAFLPHVGFSLQGVDVVGTLPLAPWEAALGAEVEVQTPDEQSVRVRVPAGSPAGRQLRLAGLGLPGRPAGDLLLTLQIVLPPSTDPQARTMWEAMARAWSDFDPRSPAVGSAAQQHDG